MTPPRDNVSYTSQKKDDFWIHAEQIRTYPANHHRCKVVRARCNIQFGKGKMKRMRKYKDPRTGEQRTTVEVEY